LKSFKDSEYQADCNLHQILKNTGHAFFQSFGRFRPIQRKAIPAIYDGKNVLIISMTASGKTEAACAPLVEKHYNKKTPWTILYISPTRALVNDLYYRLSRPAEQLHISIKRRTGDHRDDLTQIPNIIITTPESFDSMLCRNRRKDKYGHDLAYVVAIVLDEIHLLHGTARGEQIKWLIQRIQKLREYAKKMGWTTESNIQIIGLSATIPGEKTVLHEYFNDEAETIKDSGKREIETVTTNSKSTSVKSALPDYIHSIQTNEKILVFCNSRKRVDGLSKLLKNNIKKGYDVYAHHGSLSKKEREAAEYAIKIKKKVILCATSTLEIGIDIGDIDLIVLDGPPPDISSLLQRIGRGNRRTNNTRVLACSDTYQDFFIQNAMIESAQDGWLGKGMFGQNYSVIRQQIASYIFQSSKKKRSKVGINGLFNENLIDTEIFISILNKMIEDDELIREDHDIIKLGELWWDYARQMGKIHTNITQSGGANVVDIDTGSEIASGILYDGGEGLGIGGKSLKVCNWEHQILAVRDLGEKNILEGKWRYLSSSCPIFSGPPLALKRYLHIDDHIWPLIRKGSFIYVFHMGGAVRRSVLTLLHHEYKSGITDKININDWYLRIPGNFDEKFLWLADFSQNIIKIILNTNEKMLKRIEKYLGRPYTNSTLPYNVRVEEVWGWLDMENESKIIKESKWTFLDNEDKKDVLRHFIKD
jgi:ATP-dependent helicase Lhr and Lhr-like helicase